MKRFAFVLGVLFCFIQSYGQDIEFLWEQKYNDDLRDILVAANGECLVCRGNNSPYVYCFNEEDGSLLWKYNPSGASQIFDIDLFDNQDSLLITQLSDL